MAGDPQTTHAADDLWAADCIRWRGRVLTGRAAHYCHDWDGLPVDETTPEIHGCCCILVEGPAVDILPRLKTGDS